MSSPDSPARHNPPFRLLLGISLLWLPLSFLSDGLTILVLPRELERLGGDAKATLLGLLTFVGLVVAMVVQPFAGLLSDRTRESWGRKGVIGLGIALCLPCLALLSAGSLAAVATGFVLTLAAASVSQAGLQGFVPDLVPESRRGLASGLKGFMDLAGATAGFVVIGQALGAGGTSGAAVVSAGVLLAGYSVTLVFVREQGFAGAPGAGTPVVNPFRLDLKAHMDFAWLVLARFLFLLGTYAVGRYFLFFVGERLGLDPDRAAEEAGVLLGLLTLITMLAAPAAGWVADHWGRFPVMYLGAILAAAGVLALVTARSASQILAFGTLMAVGNACFSAANWALTADLVPPLQAGRFFALANFGTMGASAFAGLLGPLVDAGNRQEPGSGYTSLFVCAALASLASMEAVRRVRRRSGPQVRAGEEWSGKER